MTDHPEAGRGAPVTPYGRRMRVALVAAGITCVASLLLSVGVASAEVSCAFDTLALGKNSECDGSTCDASNQQFLANVINAVCKLSGSCPDTDDPSAECGCASTCNCCKTGENQVETELFAGVNLLRPDPAPVTPAWCQLGGRGELMGDTALCLLRDLRDHAENSSESGKGIHNRSDLDLGIGDLSVKQHVGYLDFDPAERIMHGYHDISICMPVFGCVDNLTQNFTAQLVDSPAIPPDGVCGTYPLDNAFVLDMKTDDIEHALKVEIPFGPYSTPYGVDVTVTANFRYGTFVKTVTSPYAASGGNTSDVQTIPTSDDKKCNGGNTDGEACETDEACVGSPPGICILGHCGSVLDPACSTDEECGLGSDDGTCEKPFSLFADLEDIVGDDVAERGSARVLSSHVDGSGGTGWNSQVGLGGRETDPDGEIWPEGTNRPDPIPPGAGQKPTVRNQDEAARIAEMESSVNVTAGLFERIKDLVPNICGLFECPPTLEVFIEPVVDVTFASQFNVYLSEATFQSKAAPCESDVCGPPVFDGDGPVPTIARIDSGTGAKAKFTINTGLNLVLKMDLVFGEVTVVDFKPRFAIPGGEKEVWNNNKKSPRAEARSERTPEQEDALDPAFKSFVRLTSDEEETDPEAFLQTCLAEKSPNGEPPPAPSYTAHLDDVTKELKYPCNICLHLSEVRTQCVPKPGEDDNYDCGAHGHPAINVDHCDDKCEPKALPAPKSVNLDEWVFTVPQDADKKWLCDSDAKNGCFDVCEPDGSGGYKVIASALDGPVDEGLGPRCLNGTGGDEDEDGDGYPSPVPCTANADCDDGNVCTREFCDLPDVPKIVGRAPTGVLGVCHGGTRDGQSCENSDQCPGEGGLGQPAVCIFPQPGQCKRVPWPTVSCAGGPNVGEACTSDSQCPSSECVSRSCDDGLFCNGDDTCANGHCSLHTTGSPCGSDGCCESSGTCGDDCPLALTLCDLPTGAPCDDENPCTLDDACWGGVCAGQTVCNDDNLCTSDTCTPGTTTCVNVPNGFCPAGCGDGFLDAGEECDTDNDTACPGLCIPGGQPNGCTCGPGCGNGDVEPELGESCDPPNPLINATTNLPFCRPDCTMCGDGVLQTSGGETCDDGNTLECDLVHPQKELDDCNNSCAGLVCDDPSRIRLRNGLDEVRVHGRLVPIMGHPVDLDGGVTFRLTSGETIVFETGLGAADVRERGSNREFYYRNPSARRDGGIYRLRATRARRGTYKLSIVAYGDLQAASEDMVTHIVGSAGEWSVHGRWERRPSGWLFGGVSP